MAEVGVQLIIYGRRVQEDLEGVFKEVSNAGYKGIEAGNLFELRPPEEIKRILGENSLLVAGMHSGYGDVEDEGRLMRNIGFLKEVDSRYLMCSGVGPGHGIEPYERAAETFNKVGKICRENGIFFCYHNHNWEFAEFEGVKGIHRLCELTDPEYVKLCVDVYWVTIGGEDPAEFIRRYKDRAVYFHFKDGAPGSFSELGKGVVDIPRALEAALYCSPEWIVVEQDRTDKDPFISIKESREYLKGLGL